MSAAHLVARTDEARPLGLRRAYATIADGIGADHEAGRNGRQQSRKLGHVPGRAVLEASNTRLRIDASALSMLAITSSPGTRSAPPQCSTCFSKRSSQTSVCHPGHSSGSA